MFKEERQEEAFDWTMLGKIQEGRPDLGSTTHVSVFRRRTTGPAGARIEADEP